MKIFEVTNDTQRQLRRFCMWACSKIGINPIPEIIYSNDHDEVESKRTFGHALSNGEIWVYVGNRNPADVMRTLCHELVHYKQFEQGIAHEDMDDETRQSIEDVANAMAGRLMREYGKQHVEIYS